MGHTDAKMSMIGQTFGEGNKANKGALLTVQFSCKLLDALKNSLFFKFGV
jgi:hypothetical protein